MKELRPPANFGSVYNGDEYLGATAWSDVTGRPLPDPNFTDNNKAEIKKHFERAGLGDQSDTAIERFRQVSTDYMVEIEREAEGVNFGDIDEFVNGLIAEVEAIQKRLRPKNKEGAKKTKRILQSLSFLKVDDLEEDMAQMLKSAERFRAGIMPSQKITYTTMVGNRRKQFALAFYQEFKANNWPLDKSAQSLMAKTFSISLSAAGDQVVKPTGLLSWAEKNLPD